MLRLGVTVDADLAGQLDARGGTAEEHAVDLDREALPGVAIDDDIELVGAREGDHVLAVRSTRVGQRHRILADAQIGPFDSPGEPVDCTEEGDRRRRWPGCS